MPKPVELAPVLVLGGTGEGRELAILLAAHPRLVPLSSIAGVTKRPELPPGEVRIGGFGGIDGLVAWLDANPVLALVDATHPFAITMRRHALTAARERSVPLLRLKRPSWQAEPGDHWHEVADLESALALIPTLGRRVLVALGRSPVEQLPEIAGVDWLIRSIERPSRLPAGAIWLEARPPFRIEEELQLFQDLDIDVVLSKDSGGTGAAAKLVAARTLGLSVVLLRRPHPPVGVSVVELSLIHI